MTELDLNQINLAVSKKLCKLQGIDRSQDHRTYVIPNYATDIAAAWEIIEWLDGKGYLVTMSNDGEDPKKWLVYMDSPKIDAEAATASLAICKAFLKLP